MFKNNTVFLIIVNNSCRNALFTKENTKNSNCDVIKNIAEKLKTPSAENKLLAPASEKVRRERVVCYSSLLYLTNLLYGVMPDIDFEKEKPEFVLDSKEEEIRFNLSHSGEACAIALSRGVEIGVDVQQLVNEKTARNLELRYLNQRRHIFDGAGNILYISDFLSNLPAPSLQEGSSVPTISRSCSHTQNASSVTSYGISYSSASSHERYGVQDSKSPYMNSNEKCLEGVPIRLMYFDPEDGSLTEILSIEDDLRQLRSLEYQVFDQNKKESASEISIIPTSKDEESDAEAVTRCWSVLESALKSDGSGFSGINDVEYKLKTASTYQAFFKMSDNVYSVSLTVR